MKGKAISNQTRLTKPDESDLSWDYSSFSGSTPSSA